MKEKNKPNSMQLNIKFENFSDVDNEGFVRGQCQIAYAGKNRNYSDIPKIAFENAEKSLFNIPVVGHWLDDVSNFGGHDAIFEKRGNQLVLKDNTVPFGVVPESANPRWVAADDENGNTKNYYTADVILWYERYPKQIQKVIDDGVNQSMELIVKDGEWDENYEYFTIKDFYFSALCLLGRDRDDDGNKGQDDVEPCFEDSEVTVYQFETNDKFTAQFNELITTYNIKNNNANDEGGEQEMNTEKTIEDFKKEIEELKIQTQENQSQFDDLSKEYEQLKISNETLQSELVTIKEENESLESKYSDYEDIKTERDTLKAEKQAIEEQKLHDAKESIFSSFATLLTEEDMQPIRDKMDEYSIEDIDLRLSKINSDKIKDQNAKGNKDNKNNFQMENFNRKEDDTKKKDKNKFAISL